MVAWLHGCMVAWLHGCMVAWLHGCMVAWLHGCMLQSVSVPLRAPSLCDWERNTAQVGCWGWTGRVSCMWCVRSRSIGSGVMFVCFQSKVPNGKWSSRAAPRTLCAEWEAREVAEGSSGVWL